MSRILKKVHCLGRYLVLMQSEKVELDGTIRSIYIANINPIIHVSKKTTDDYVLSFTETKAMVEKLLNHFKEECKKGKYKMTTKRMEHE